ncbi:MAG TPA: hypothetical protein VM639_22505 [Dongiaceae bacterium]|nr:hypothetical protein [Dongiaceae bacterium]
MGFPATAPFGFDIWAIPVAPPGVVPIHSKSGAADSLQLPNAGLQKVLYATWHKEGGPIGVSSFKRGDSEDAFLAITISEAVAR